MVEKLLSISVAAYNVEKYLDKLIESIISSSRMEAIEVIIVNDGSKDDTFRVASEYQKKYPESIRVIDKDNGGHGSTINCGIRNATGKYFRALDGDDWVNPEHLAGLVDKLTSIETDIIISDYCKCYEDGREIIGDEFHDLVDGQEYSFETIIDMVSWMRYHTVIYRTKILQAKSIQLDEHCFYVDREFMLFPIPYTNSIYYYKDYIYCYRLGLTDQSVSPESRMKHIDNSMTVTQSLLSFWEKEKGSLSGAKRDYIISGISGHCVWHYNSLFLFPATPQKKKEIIKYDQMIKNSSQEIYAEMEKHNKKIKMMRKLNYITYYLLHRYINRKKTS